MTLMNEPEKKLWTDAVLAGIASQKVRDEFGWADSVVTEYRNREIPSFTNTYTEKAEAWIIAREAVIEAARNMISACTKEHNQNLFDALAALNALERKK